MTVWLIEQLTLEKKSYPRRIFVAEIQPYRDVLYTSDTVYYARAYGDVSHATRQRWNCESTDPKHAYRVVKFEEERA